MPNYSPLTGLLARLSDARSVVVAGAGGGFDVYGGLPIAHALRELGKTVHLANLSFTDLSAITAASWVHPAVAVIDHDTNGPLDYFPERTLARWLHANGLPSTVHALRRTGVAPLTAGYEALVDHLDADATVLVDGGTDILMFGDEAGLGTPEEDMASLAAVNALVAARVPQFTAIVTCIGFGIDAFHGVDHTQVLQNIAALERAGGYLGAASLTRTSPEGQAYLDAVAHAQDYTPRRPSIVNGSIAAAVRGDFANAQFTARTHDTELFINPLMALYFAFDLPTLAAHSLYLDQLIHTTTAHEITQAIETFRERLPRTRPRRTFPH